MRPLFSNNEIVEESHSTKYPKISWNLLGKMNAGNFIPNKSVDYFDYLEGISHYDFKDSFPMLSYYIASVSKLASNKKLLKERMYPIFESLVDSVVLLAEIYKIDSSKFSAGNKSEGNKIVFDSQCGDDVTTFVQEWVDDLDSLEIEIIDPYFTVKDLEFIAEVIQKNPSFTIKILTSYTNYTKLKQLSGENEIDDFIRQFWEKQITSAGMPYFDIIFCGVASLGNTMPIHDRWWLSNSQGMTFGGSINGIGAERISSISKMLPEEVILVRQKVTGYLNKTNKKHREERIKYLTVTA